MIIQEIFIPIAILLGLVLIGLLLFYHPIQNITRIRRTSAYLISSLPSEGLVEVTGRAEGEMIQSPITGTKCLLWEAEIKEKKGGGKGGGWFTVYKNSYKKDFFIHDETGMIKVSLLQANCILRNHFSAGSNMFKSLDSNILTAVHKLGVKTETFLGIEYPLKIDERLISPGDSVFVLGHIEYKEGQKTITTGAKRALLISDRSKKETLHKLYLDVFLRMLFMILIGVLIIFIWYILLQVTN
jgi:hypothetical protein